MVLRHHCRLLPGAEGSQLGSSGDGSPDHARSKKCPSSRGGHRCAVRRHTDLASPHLRRRPPISAVSFLGGRHSQNRRRRSRRLLQAINCGRTPRKEKKEKGKKTTKTKRHSKEPRTRQLPPPPVLVGPSNGQCCRFLQKGREQNVETARRSFTLVERFADRRTGTVSAQPCPTGLAGLA